jgi:hypothetical protein
LYRYAGANAPVTNLGAGAAYYVVVTGDTTFKLTASRYDAAIRAVPAVVNIAIEGDGDRANVRFLEYSYVSGAVHDLQFVRVPGMLGPAGSNTIDRTDGLGWAVSFEVDQSVKVVGADGKDFGTYTIEEIRNDGLTLVLAGASFHGMTAVMVSDAEGERFRNIHETYGSGVYDPNSIFRFTPAEWQRRIEARTVSPEALRYVISVGLFRRLYPDLDIIGGVQEPNAGEKPNIIGGRVTLMTPNGSVGNVSDLITVELGQG